MTDVPRFGTLLTWLVLCIACNSADRLTAPSSLPTPQSSTVQASPAAAVPPLIGPASTYLFAERLSYPIRDYTIASKYVLYDDGAFSLQYQSIAAPYVGTYRQDNGSIALRFASDSRWSATATINGDSLEVRYNTDMELSDFENAVYQRSQ
jgi:hypothetical protein